MSRVRLAHLSDPHFGTVTDEVRGALLASLAELGPSLILLTGDITQRARRGEFRQARAFVQELAPIPVFAVPGNHDIPLWNLPLRLFAPYRNYARFQKVLERESLHQGVEILALNSTSRWRHIQGAFRRGSLEKKLRQDRPAQIRLVAFHHPLDCAKTVDEKNLLRGGAAVAAALARAEVDLVVGGHIHDPHVALSTVRYPEAGRSMIFSVAGTCLSWRTRKNAPNSFHLIELETGPQARIEITRYDHEGSTFKPFSPERFVREPGTSGWTRARGLTKAR